MIFLLKEKNGIFSKIYRLSSKNKNAHRL